MLGNVNVMRYLLMDEQAGKKKKVTFDFNLNVWSCNCDNGLLEVGNITYALSNIMSVILSCHFFFRFVFDFDFDLFSSIILSWLFLYAMVYNNIFVFVTSFLFFSVLLYLTSRSASILGWSSFKNTVKAFWTSCYNFSWRF